jgi:hypothetical protein
MTPAEKTLGATGKFSLNKIKPIRFIQSVRTSLAAPLGPGAQIHTAIFGLAACVA